ncbi:MAG TPA: hypothetical protein VMW23_03410 [Sedimentisphaerales bacterium]|nr:hypothetical protein [Sedimentisphaerales bacterium]
MTERLEEKLDSFNGAERQEALSALCEQIHAGNIELPEQTDAVNLHCHTFFSYNSYGYSPSKFAYLARKRGLAVAGVVDFDVLDALEEFLQACKLVGLKGCGGLESRVFVPEFSDKVINSPGEPGISYHMGIGFPQAKLEGSQKDFLCGLHKTAQQRNRALTRRVNEYLRPAVLDYDKDVLPLTPAGNPTERHVCLAYARKAAELFDNHKALADFWSEKLGVDGGSLELPEGRTLLDTIRAKTMKRGGVGYVQPDKGSFPLLSDMNRFALASGAIPTATWLDGTSNGERDITTLLQTAMSTGTAALNIIPDRNYKVGVKDEKLRNLYEVVELAESLGLPIVVGTEMNSPGQKFVDSFQTKELKPLVPVFLKGAYIVYAHSVLQQKCGLGYTSDWAKKNFDSVKKKNEFYQTLGKLVDPEKQDLLSGSDENVTAQQILETVKQES